MLLSCLKFDLTLMYTQGIEIPNYEQAGESNNIQ